MKKNSLVSGAIILSVGGVLAKIFSAVYRIALTRALGGVGIGIYQLIFPIYSLCVVLATAGLPMAISKVIAKHKGEEKAIVKKCLKFITLISLVLAMLLVAFSRVFSIIQGNNEIAICYIVLAPTIIIVAISSVLRGYFQGVQNFAPSAVSNIVEQFAKLVFGLVLCLSLSSIGLLQSIIGAVLGIVISEVVSLAILWLCYKKQKTENDLPTEVTIKNLIKDILPITLTNLILPLAFFVDSLIVVNLISINFSKEVSIFLYGLESGAVSTIINLPTIFSFALASVIMPNLSRNSNPQSKAKNLSLAIKVVLIITVPFAVCFTLFPTPILNVLYGGKLNAYGINGISVSSSLLVVSGFGLVFLALNQLLSSALQALDFRSITIRNTAIAVAVKFVIEILFLPSQMLNIYTLAVSNTVCYVLVFCLNFAEISKHIKLKFNFLFAGKLILCNLFAVITIIAVLVIKVSTLSTFLAFGGGVIVYFLSLILFRVLSLKQFRIFNKNV